MPFVVQRLNVLREELTRKKLNVVTANHAIKTAVARIVIDPERSCLDVHWRDSDIASEVPFWSRHITAFSDLKTSQDVGDRSPPTETQK